MIALPLVYEMNRCLAHGNRPGEFCHKADTCARHITIRHDARPVPASYHACSTTDMNLYIPIEGFAEDEGEA